MQKVRKDFTLSQSVIDRLAEEDNMSAVVEKALKEYFSGKDSYRKIVGLASSLQVRLDASPQPTTQRTTNTMGLVYNQQYDVVWDRNSDEEFHDQSYGLKQLLRAERKVI